jgi:hypothetical protein
MRIQEYLICAIQNIHAKQRAMGSDLLIDIWKVSGSLAEHC